MTPLDRDAQMLQWQRLVNYAGIDSLPEGLEQLYLQYRPDEGGALIDRGFLQSLFKRFSLPEDAAAKLLCALDAVEADDQLLALSRFLAWDMCSARNRCDCDTYTAMAPACLEKEAAGLYSFLMLLACVQPSQSMLAQRGVPLAHYKDIPYRPMKGQFEKLARGEYAVADFPWDMNFYTCAIFQFDRFLFIPCRFEDPLTVLRSRLSGETTAVFDGGLTFRSDGQYDGVNGVKDSRGAFTTVWARTRDTLTANPIHPFGYCERQPRAFAMGEWQAVLTGGDLLLALHIPAGPGYTPQRLKSSMLPALEFYSRYFPELEIKGFWSESWLYDPRLALVLDENTSNIVQVQRQFYNYPIPEGDGMLRYELFGSPNADYRAIPPGTRLQRAAAAYMDSGARFHTTSMFVLREDAARMGEAPYVRTGDRERFINTVDSHLKA